jgi:uncharacterized membrane protein YfhO
MSIDGFNSFVLAHLAKGWTEKTFSLWFTGHAVRLDANSPEPALAELEYSANLSYYSLLGVKYFVMPATDKAGLPFGRLVYDSEVKIYENALALPRVFVASSVINAPSVFVSQNMVGEPGFDAKNTAVIEKAPPSWFGSQKAGITSANITAYNANSVAITASADAPAIVVLSDTYYQGWKAYVDGTPSEIYRVDGLLRGVFIEKGAHVIEFKYLPYSFLAGSAIGAVAVLLCAGMFFIGVTRDK